MTKMQANMKEFSKKQHLLISIRAALVTGEESALCKLVKEYRTI